MGDRQSDRNVTVQMRERNRPASSDPPGFFWVSQSDRRDADVTLCGGGIVVSDLRFDVFGSSFARAIAAPKMNKKVRLIGREVERNGT